MSERIRLLLVAALALIGSLLASPTWAVPDGYLPLRTIYFDQDSRSEIDRVEISFDPRRLRLIRDFRTLEDMLAGAHSPIAVEVITNSIRLLEKAPELLFEVHIERGFHRIDLKLQTDISNEKFREGTVDIMDIMDYSDDGHILNLKAKTELTRKNWNDTDEKIDGVRAEDIYDNFFGFVLMLRAKDIGLDPKVDPLVARWLAKTNGEFRVENPIHYEGGRLSVKDEFASETESTPSIQLIIPENELTEISWLQGDPKHRLKFVLPKGTNHFVDIRSEEFKTWESGIRDRYSSPMKLSYWSDAHWPLKDSEEGRPQVMVGLARVPGEDRIQTVAAIRKTEELRKVPDEDNPSATHLISQAGLDWLSLAMLWPQDPLDNVLRAQAEPNSDAMKIAKSELRLCEEMLARVQFYYQRNHLIDVDTAVYVNRRKDELSKIVPKD